MDRKKDAMDSIIQEDLLMEAENIKKELENSDVEGMSQELKDRIKGRLHEQIDEYERNRVYEKLSEEDREALELGRQILKDREDAKDKKVVYRKKRPKMWIALAAVLVLVLAIGVTGVGGPERIIEMMRVVIGEREMVRIDTEDDNYVIPNENEEEAYQKLKDVFGVEAVKIIHRPEGMEFIYSEVDSELQTAVLIYDYKGNSIHYHISSHHTESSWGVDVEDKITDQYYVDHEKQGKIKITEYEKPETKIKRYSANYTYKGLEYMLIGVMEKEKFEFLIKKLKFF